MKQNVSLEQLLTPQESVLVGSTSFEELRRNVKWHTPEAISSGGVAIDAANRIRQQTGWYEGGMLGVILGRDGVAIRLSELDPITGETIGDPRIGVRDEKTGEYLENEELTERLLKMLKESGMELRLRDEIARVSGGERRG